jgi:signal transduction histidine kinase
LQRILFGLIVSAFCMLAWSGGAVAQAESGVSVIKGSIDLSSDDRLEKIVSLEGEWEFYENRLLLPQELTALPVEPDYWHVPELWGKQRASGTRAEAVNYGTYRLLVKLSADEIGRQRVIYISDFVNAYTLWINGKPFASNGVVGKSAGEEVPQSGAKLIFFEPDGQYVEIVLQASNFTARHEGAFKSVLYGASDQLQAYLIKEQLKVVLLIGGLFVIGIYHLIIYGIRRTDRSTLFIGLFAIIIGIRGWVKSTYLVHLLAPSLSWEVVVKLDYLTGHIAYVFLVMLVKQMFPLEVNARVARLSNVLTLLFCLFIIIAPAPIYTQTLSLQFAVMFGIAANTLLYACVLAAKRKREGALVNLIGYLVIAVACVNDVLLYQRVITSVELLYQAIFIFVLLQAIIISYRYSRLFEHNVALTSELTQLNHTLEHKVEARTADLYLKNEELAIMHRSRTEMMANISHDMGSPLVGIQMNMQLIKDRLVDPLKQQELIQSLLDKASYVKRLNDDLFELSLLESGQFSFQFSQIKLGTYMDTVVRRLTVELASEQMVLDIGKQETRVNGEEVWIRADSLRIGQVLNNYIGNAVKFSRSKSSLIRLNWTIVGAPDQAADTDSSYEVVVEVEDYGMGIAAEDLPFLFDRFYRKSEGHERGSGLGLAIVKEIVERHQGRVGVASKLGEGSAFFFTLPAFIGLPEEI